MKKGKLLKVILILAFLITVGLRPVSADVGSFDSYDSGSDWGSSSSDWDWGDSSSSSWSSWDDDYSSSGSGDFILGMLLGSSNGRIATIIIILGFIVFAYIRRKGEQEFRNRFDIQRHKTNKYYGTVYTTNVHDVPQTHIYAGKIKEVDPLFSEEKFLSWAKDLYVKLQHAWTAREWEEMRPFETENLFEQHSAQLQEYIKNNTINVVDRIAVNYATIYNFKQTAEKDIVEVALKATKKDYIINATTQEVVEGNKEQYRITVYKMTFERTRGKLTQEGTDELDAKNCPNCGASIKVTSAGKCEYCGSIVTTGVHDWVLSNIEPLRKEY